MDYQTNDMFLKHLCSHWPTLVGLLRNKQQQNLKFRNADVMKKFAFIFFFEFKWKSCDRWQNQCVCMSPFLFHASETIQNEIFTNCNFSNYFFVFCSQDIEASRAAGLDLYGYGDIDELLMDPSYATMDQKVSSLLSPLAPPPPPVSVAASVPPPSSLLNGKPFKIAFLIF